ncbi:MAG: TolC family protein [Bacteroides sp.]
MKKHIIVLLLLCCGTYLSAQDQINSILQQIEANNPELKANAHLFKAEVAETKSTNNLANPTVSFSNLWDSKNSSETENELEVAQEFEFPTAYLYRNKANKKKISALEALYQEQRQAILLRAKELLLDIIMLNQQREFLDQRLSYANQLFDGYQLMMDAGDATSIELNKIKLEKLNIQTEHTLNRSELENKYTELKELNGNQPISFERSTYPHLDLPAYEVIRDEFMSSSYALKSAQHEYESAQKQIALNKTGWLPSLSIGYRRNGGSNGHSNGLSVGFSIPLFNNRGKVSSAKATALSKAFTQDLVQNQLLSELNQAYQDALYMKEQIQAYDGAVDVPEILALLEKALDGGELNMTTYFVEVATVYQSAQNYIQINNRYQKQLAKLYKHRL